MIQLNNITKNKDGSVSMDCHVIDRIENQDFSLTFNPDTREILSDMEGIDEYYAGHAVLHIYYRLKAGEPLPSKALAKWV